MLGRITEESPGNYCDVNAYVSRISPLEDLEEIGVPLLNLHARDDPLIDAASIPLNTVNFNPFVMFGLTDYGGHCGWLTSVNRR